MSEREVIIGPVSGDGLARLAAQYGRVETFDLWAAVRAPEETGLGHDPMDEALTIYWICNTCGAKENVRGATMAVGPLHACQEEADPPCIWTDRHGDEWALGDDGLMHSPETAPFPREHVERKWGPLAPKKGAEPMT